jgi:hypothetical protein
MVAEALSGGEALPTFTGGAGASTATIVGAVRVAFVSISCCALVGAEGARSPMMVAPVSLTGALSRAAFNSADNAAAVSGRSARSFATA